MRIESARRVDRTGKTEAMQEGEGEGACAPVVLSCFL